MPPLTCPAACRNRRLKRVERLGKKKKKKKIPANIICDLPLIGGDLFTATLSETQASGNKQIDR